MPIVRGVLVKLVPLTSLRPHERIDESRLWEVLESIRSEGVLHYPVIVDSKTLVILDGHHRVESLRILGAKLIPALLVDYDDDCVTVGSWRPGVRVTKDMVRLHGLRGNLLPPKTSRHRLCFEVPRIDVPLDKLKG